ncbi:PREDICTED: uncharacterized protein C20orf96 homolog [Elephantulus edwardii]|uniref:uncharacterized protein C20orf96 homolog n=1 Tax=Elephantulus edwardii TaxID=28737 RepID=UPI0003F07C85|nr:PREDICTED: uncharacterized protein C20orf96 homolog [Elephantulus edwardii]
MAHPFPGLSRPSIRSKIYQYKAPDYSPWQRSSQKTALPPVQPNSGHKKSKMKSLASMQKDRSDAKTMGTAAQLGRLYQSRPRGGESLAGGRALVPRPRRPPPAARSCLPPLRPQMVLRSRRTSLQQLENLTKFLIQSNQDLVKTIQATEDTTARKMREMLQQQDILGKIVGVSEQWNKKSLEELWCELQEWEKKEEYKIRCLEQQVEQLNAKVKETHYEVNFLSTYMDHEYPGKLVQIATLLRQVQQLKDIQQDELDDLSEMWRTVQKSFFDKIRRREEDVLRSLVLRLLRPHEEILMQNSWDNQLLGMCADKFREFIDQSTEEMPVLKAQVQHLQAQVQRQREMVFEDVLLRRRKCTPDMEVLLDIPVEEVLPF